MRCPKLCYISHFRISDSGGGFLMKCSFLLLSTSQEPLKARQRHGSLKNCILNLPSKVLHSFYSLDRIQKKQTCASTISSPLYYDLRYHCINSHSRGAVIKVSSEISEVTDTNSWPLRLKIDEEAKMFSFCGMYFICTLCGSKVNIRETFSDRGRWKEHTRPTRGGAHRKLSFVCLFVCWVICFQSQKNPTVF